MVTRRNELVKAYCHGKRVLDIGFVNNDKTMKLHKELNAICDLTGIDIDKMGVEHAKKQGFKARYMNAETMELNQKFDIIMAGDIIEHLNNFGMFIQRAVKHLTKNGKLIITTPNPLYFRLNENGSFHTCRFSFKNLEELLSRYGLRIEEKGYTQSELYPVCIEDFLPSKIFRNTIYVVAVRK